MEISEVISIDDDFNLDVVDLTECIYFLILNIVPESPRSKAQYFLKILNL